MLGLNKYLAKLGSAGIDKAKGKVLKKTKTKPVSSNFCSDPRA